MDGILVIRHRSRCHARKAVPVPSFSKCCMPPQSSLQIIFHQLPQAFSITVSITTGAATSTSFMRFSRHHTSAPHPLRSQHTFEVMISINVQKPARLIICAGLVRPRSFSTGRMMG